MGQLLLIYLNMKIFQTSIIKPTNPQTLKQMKTLKQRERRCSHFLMFYVCWCQMRLLHQKIDTLIRFSCTKVSCALKGRLRIAAFEVYIHAYYTESIHLHFRHLAKCT